MSQAKPSAEAQDLKVEEPSGRVQTRRSSRSAHSGSPAMASKELQDMESMSPSSRSSSPETDARVTRSQSTESSTTAPAPRKRRRGGRAPGPNKKRTDTPGGSSGKAVARGDEERETRNTTQRMTKEAREARKAERDGIIKQRLSELDQLEKEVRDGNHPEYHQLLQDIEAKREKRLDVLKVWQSLTETNIKNALECDKKIAYDQFHLDKLKIRRAMMHQVQQKINTLEQEYNALSAQNNDPLPNWIPPDRPPMISSLTLGLDEEDVMDDLERARKRPSEHGDEDEEGPAMDVVATSITDDTVSYYHPSKPKSPPIDMLATLADHQYPPNYTPTGSAQDGQEHTILPPLSNSWREGVSLPI